jgi:thiamine pyrophosphate-dependent acetolactate synthase large subunit-like protein
VARAPLVLLGGGVRAAGCRDAALALGRQIGAAFGTTTGGRTALPDEPWNLGVLGMMGGPLARAVADRADLVLVLGAALDRYNTDGCRLGADARLVRVDRRPPEELWAPAPDPIDITGDLPEALAGLTSRLAGHHATGLRTAALRRDLDDERARAEALAEIATADGPNPWAVVSELDAMLPPDAHVVVGIGHFWYFVAPYLRPDPHRTFHFTTGFASIGQALPAGVGAALAGAGRPVVVVEGDGSVAMNIQELQAAVRHGADLLVIVLDNQAYGSEYHKLALAGFDPRAGAFDETPFDLVAVATSMGATARRAEDADELRAALRDLVPARGVRLLDARISTSTVSETYARLHGTPPGVVDPTTRLSHPAELTVHAPSRRPTS